MIISLYEHKEFRTSEWIEAIPIHFRNNKQCPIFTAGIEETEEKTDFTIRANYYIGIGRLNNNCFISVSPKINSKLREQLQQQLEYENEEEKVNTVVDITQETENSSNFTEVNVLRMLTEISDLPNASKEIGELLDIDWQTEEIEITQLHNDYLSLLLIVQYLTILKSIVRKGLMKSYYTVEENLNSKIKGKILINRTVKENIYKNQIIKNYCRYQEFGYHNKENRFLKKVTEFVRSYLQNNKSLFGDSFHKLEQILRYSESSFADLKPLENTIELKSFRHNAFYSEYTAALKVGIQILKRFSYAVTRTKEESRKTPPHWIDMPRLFELYTYSKLLKNSKFTGIKYHLKTYGNEIDFVGYYRNSEEEEFEPVVIDAKYKLHYDLSQEHQDMRQVSGYARLSKTYQYFNEEESNRLIDCLIIYPTSVTNQSEFKPIKAYRNMFKMGIELPTV